MPIGIPAAIAISGALGAGSSILGGALAGRKKQYTSTSTPSWSPQQQQLLEQLQKYSSGLLTDPSAGLSPIKAGSIESINRRYGALPGQISRVMATRGYGSSGAMGDSLYKTAFARSGELSDLDSRIAQLTLAQKNQGASLADELLKMTRTTTTTGSSPSTAASDALMSGGNALSGIAQLLALQQALNPTAPAPVSSVAQPGDYSGINAAINDVVARGSGFGAGGGDGSYGGYNPFLF